MTEVDRLMQSRGPGTAMNMSVEDVEKLARLLAEERNRASRIQKIKNKYPAPQPQATP